MRTRTRKTTPRSPRFGVRKRLGYGRGARAVTRAGGEPDQPAPRDQFFGLAAFSCSTSFMNCSTFSLLVQKFSVRSSLLTDSENLCQAEVQGLVSTFGS